LLSFRLREVMRAFPQDIHESVEKVLNYIKKFNRSEWEIMVASSSSCYVFDNVCLPSWVKLPDLEYKTSDFNAQTVYYCLQTMSIYGRVREKYIKIILSSDSPRWVTPFIVKASTDRVAEVVQAIYDGLSEKLKKYPTIIKAICENSCMTIAR